MAFERNWTAVPPVLLTVNGSTEGVVIVTDTAGFYVKQLAILTNNATILNVQIKRVVNSTTLWVGIPGPSMLHNLDVSAFTVATASRISAVEQPKTTLPMEARMLATYEQEPIDAWRTKAVDAYGNGYTSSNPLPVSIDSEITIGEVEVVGPSGHILDPNSDGSVKTIQLFTLPFDAITATYPSSAQEIYQSRIGGIAGAIQQTLTVNYVDSTKNLILNVSRT